MNSPGHSVFLGACLIVKDESERLPACLASLQGVVDEIAVYDTGSTDDTVAIAEAAGARVVRGTWPGSFAAARNEALAMSRATWVLAVDADEVIRTDGHALRNFLQHSADSVFAVLIENVVAADRSADFRHHHTRLFQRDGVRWEGVVHEVLADSTGTAVPPAGLDAALLTIVHHGYSSREVVRAKGERNSRLVAEQIAAAVADPAPAPPEELRPLLVHLIRSEEGSGRRSEAIAVARSLHETLPRETRAWEQVTDLLVQLSVSAGRAAAAAPVLRRWRAHRPATRWMDYLDASVLAATGDRPGARALLATLSAGGDVEDTVGVRVTADQLRREHAELVSG